jgi:hypothetical protein
LSTALRFSLTEVSIPALEAGQLGSADSIPENKEAASSFWPVTEVQNAWRCASTPHRRHGTHRVDFTSSSYFPKNYFKKMCFENLKFKFLGNIVGLY